MKSASLWIDTTTLFGINVPNSLLTMGAVTLVNLLFVTLFYKELKLSTFDPGLAAALGFSPVVVYYLLLFLTSVTAVTAFDAVGSVLLVAFVVVPPAAAYLLTDKLYKMLLFGVLIAALSSFLGYASAVALDVSIGGMMAVYTGVFSRAGVFVRAALRLVRPGIPPRRTAPPQRRAHPVGSPLQPREPAPAASARTW